MDFSILGVLKPIAMDTEGQLYFVPAVLVHSYSQAQSLELEVCQVLLTAATPATMTQAEEWKALADWCLLLLETLLLPHV